MLPSVGVRECPAHHCIAAFESPELEPYLARFDSAAMERQAEIVRLLREDANPEKRASAVFILSHIQDAEEVVRILVPSLEDPAGEVRNNVLRVLGFIALQDPTIAIPFSPLSKALDDPESGVRNKAVQLAATLADRPEYRSDIMTVLPAVLRLLRLNKPNTREPAYRILKTISGEDFGGRAYDQWQSWVERQLYGSVVPPQDVGTPESR